MEIENKEQRSTKKQLEKSKIKINSNRKIKAIGNITPTMDHHPRTWQMGNTNL